jgi:hypothetical protein
MVVGHRGRARQPSQSPPPPPPSSSRSGAPPPPPSSRPRLLDPPDHTPQGTLCSTGNDSGLPFICHPPSESSLASEPDSASLPLGTLGRRPLVDICVVHRSDEINVEERSLDLGLVAVVGGIRPRVSLLDIHHLIADSFNIPGDSFTMQRYQPEDFLLKFSYYDDMLHVLHDPPPIAPFTLVFKHWRCQLTASVEDLYFKGSLVIHGISAHA